MNEQRHAALINRPALLWVLGMSAAARTTDAFELQSPPAEDWRANLTALVLLCEERMAFAASRPLALIAAAQSVFHFALQPAPADLVVPALNWSDRQLLDELHDILDLVEADASAASPAIARVGAVLAAVVIRESAAVEGQLSA